MEVPYYAPDQSEIDSICTVQNHFAVLFEEAERDARKQIAGQLAEKVLAEMEPTTENEAKLIGLLRMFVREELV
jgi:hypothetical protein